MARKLYTIGSSNRAAAEFIAMLREYGITHLFDVRSRTGSRTLHFDESRYGNLSHLLGQHGIVYDDALHVVLGGAQGDTRMTLGGFRTYTRTHAFGIALDRLKGAVCAVDGASVILCCERDPKACHRKIIGDVLMGEGWEIIHLI